VPVLAAQLRSPLLVLLAGAAVVSYFLGERTDAVIIGVILVVSVGLGFTNEYRAARAAEALHSRIRHEVTVVRDGAPVQIDVVGLVPGDLVELQRGQVVPADLVLVSTAALLCDEGILTGEAAHVEKRPADEAALAAAGPGASPDTEDPARAWMGTIVVGGSGVGIVVATGGRTEFGRMALALGTRHGETEFQAGLRRFSALLVIVAAVLTTAVFVVNLVLHRPIIDALLFSLAIAVGITPQLLPAIVSTSLTVGSRTLARRRVLVKRLVCIEDLGDIQILMTDKTGTLTEGRIELMRSLGPDGASSDEPVVVALPCTSLPASQLTMGDQAPGDLDVLDAALWASPLARRGRAAVAPLRRMAVLPFDNDRQLASVVVEQPDGGRELWVKGAPEQVLARCRTVPAGAKDILDVEFSAGGRVVAAARRVRSAGEGDTLVEGEERDLDLVGFLVFTDPPKASSRQALTRLHSLGIDVKVITGDNPLVAQRVCQELGLTVAGTVTGAQLHDLDDTRLRDLVAVTTIFARVSPEDKQRIVHAQRAAGLDVAFLGDGVNDASAIHAADIGISVDTATDVAKDAADIVLLEKDLGVLADGVIEGRRIFANTIKYVLMGTSSNFGNMFSAAIASAILPFLPMLPSQILLGNLLYDTSQLAIPGDAVDDEQLRRPSHWDLRLVRRWMLLFGPVSSAFDLGTFAVLLWAFHADAELFHSAWFVESLATQALVIFVIRTRRSPSWRSRPSLGLAVAVLVAVLIGVVLPFTPAAAPLGFVPVPGSLLGVIVAMVAAYLVIVEVAKRSFFRLARTGLPEERPRRTSRRERRVHRRAARFSSARLHAEGAERHTDRLGG
jgi:Mg2+-importing ATPase